MTETCIKVENICIKRSSRTILTIPDLSINKSEFVSVLGTNGAGKTTLLKLLCGLIKPDSGEIELEGVKLSSVSQWKKTNLRKRIGYIPQQAEYNAQLPFTLREIVSMGRTGARGLFAAESREGKELIDYWTGKLGLEDLRTQPFNTLSGGEQQKALLARVMVQQPDILMLDEPCGNLDFHWKQQLTDIIEGLHRETGITVILVSHETNLVPPGCERIVIISDGKIIADGGSRQIFDSDALERAYGCPIEVINAAGRKFAVTHSEKKREES